MKGKYYFNWFTEDEKSKWLDNFHQQTIQSDINVYMERFFPQYHTFFFLGFDIRESNEGEVYWLDIFRRNKNFDGVVVKPGFSFKGEHQQPKVF